MEIAFTSRRLPRFLSPVFRVLYILQTQQSFHALLYEKLITKHCWNKRIFFKAGLPLVQARKKPALSAGWSCAYLRFVILPELPTFVRGGDLLFGLVKTEDFFEETDELLSDERIILPVLPLDDVSCFLNRLPSWPTLALLFFLLSLRFVMLPVPSFVIGGAVFFSASDGTW